MATETIRLSAIFPASPERLYEAWLNAGEHTRMTGGIATIDARVGGRHTAWDGYIEGEIVELEPGRRLVQTWRSSDFPTASPPSRLELRFVEVGAGARLDLIHSEIPEGQGTMYDRGWQENYFAPMRAYFRTLQNGETPRPVEELPPGRPPPRAAPPPPPRLVAPNERVPPSTGAKPAKKKAAASAAKKKAAAGAAKKKAAAGTAKKKATAGTAKKKASAAAAKKAAVAKKRVNVKKKASVKTKRAVKGRAAKKKR